MKLAIITDQHFGARGDHQIFDAYFQKFYEKVFFPVLDELGIDTVLDLGDTFDRRKFINFLTLNNARSYYFDQLRNRSVNLHLLVGNHCTFYRNTNSVNSPKLLLGDYQNVRIVENAEEAEFDGLKVLLVPWICADNQSYTMNLIYNTTAEVCMGHLEIDGFEMYRGQPNIGGERPDTFRKFDQVFSGHFHHRSTKGNISYLGNPYELTWSDFDDPRGFHIYDTATRQLHFIENPFRMFFKIHYDDKTCPLDYAQLTVKEYKDRFVKLIVVNKTDFLAFDRFVDRLYNAGPAEIKIIENMADYDESAVDDESIDVEDTPTLLEQYVDATETDLDKGRLKTFLKSLYVEALAQEEANN
jgi:DNA repair exonuclease SbcCD nuclease subunit